MKLYAHQNCVMTQIWDVVSQLLHCGLCVMMQKN